MAWNIGTEAQRLSCPPPPMGKLMDFDAFRRGEGCVYRTLFGGPNPPAAHFGPQGAFTIAPKPKLGKQILQAVGLAAPAVLSGLGVGGAPLAATTLLGSLGSTLTGGQELGGGSMAGFGDIIQTGLGLLTGSGFSTPRFAPASPFTTAASVPAVVVRGASLVPHILRNLAAKMGLRRITIGQFWGIFKKFGPSFFAGALTAQEMQALVTHAATRRRASRGVSMADMKRTRRTMKKLIGFNHDLRSLCGVGGARPIRRRSSRRCK